jgi:nucleotide-binding universal stress UspA family protein
VAGAAARAARPPERHPLLEELMSAALRVLIAVDGSDNALAAARCWSAWHCADAQALHAVLLAVAPPLPHPWPGTGAEPGSSVESAPTGMGERQLESAREAFARTRLSWEAAVRIGAPAAVLVDEAQRQRADLLVLGTRGLTPLRGLLFGSVALRVAQSSAVPVWLMPPQAPCPQALGRRLRLLVAVDGSDASNAAAAWVARAASRFGDVHIELLSVQPPFSLVEGMIDAAAGQFDHWSQRVGRDAIDAARGAMGETTARIEADVRTGEPSRPSPPAPTRSGRTRSSSARAGSAPSARRCWGRSRAGCCKPRGARSSWCHRRHAGTPVPRANSARLHTPHRRTSAASAHRFGRRPTAGQAACITPALLHRRRAAGAGVVIVLGSAFGSF